MLSLRIDSHIGFRRLSHSGVEPKCTEYLFIVFMSEIKLSLCCLDYSVAMEQCLYGLVRH